MMDESISRGGLAINTENGNEWMYAMRVKISTKGNTIGGIPQIVI